YIRDQFEALYQDELVETKVIEAITNDFLTVSQQQNKALVKKISIQKIMNTIDKLPNYKVPGSDGLTYKFYKVYQEELALILKIVCNDMLSLGTILDL
ncbi:42695_t:CDS:1, partial [Gigaspora margarita]